MEARIRFHRSNKNASKKGISIQFEREIDAWITHHCDVICRVEEKEWMNERTDTHTRNWPTRARLYRSIWSLVWCVRCCLRHTVRYEQSQTYKIILGSTTKKATNSTRKKKYINFINWCVAGRFGNFYKVWPLKAFLVSLASISDTPFIYLFTTDTHTHTHPDSAHGAHMISCIAHFIASFLVRRRI